MKVFDLVSLEQEKARLRLALSRQERDFQYKFAQFEHKLAPIGHFLMPKESESTPSGENESLVAKGVRLAIPFLVDRLTLGTRGLIINRGLTALLQFLAGKISQDRVAAFGQQALHSGLEALKIRKKK